MDEPSATAARVLTPPWQPPPPTRSMYSFNSQPLSPTPAEAAASSSSPRSPVARRRRVLGRIGRSGSDPRNSSGLTFNPEAPDFVGEAGSKKSAKRKATAFAKPGKSHVSHTNPSMPNLQTSHTNPPIIRLDDILPLATGSIVSPAVDPASRSWTDSSDDDLDDLDLAIVRTLTPNRRQANRFSVDLSNRLRLADESKKLKEAIIPVSAVLVSSEGSSLESMLSAGPERLRYLPCAALPRADKTSSLLLTTLPSHCDFVERSQRTTEPSKAVWLVGELPVELFDLITTHLARDDVKAMRLVNREFERKVSRSLFHTSVVPFNTEIYDMIDDERKTIYRSLPSIDKGKKKMKIPSPDPANRTSALEPAVLQWQNAKEDKEGKVYKGHGLRVFRGFGPHIKRFGMSFEISEKQLSFPPTKKELDHIEAYHGSYDWPSENYARFATLAGLENAADETSRMKAAFSNLEIVRELALSIDSGLGWLNGPDKSLRAVVFDQPTTVLGSPYPVPDHAAQAASEFWAALQQSHASFDTQSNFKETTLEYRPRFGSSAEIEGLRNNIYSQTSLWSVVDSSRVMQNMPSQVTSGCGVLYNTARQQTSDKDPKFRLSPGDLNKEQREWLLETQWAQQAFLESYVLAVIDNPSTFANVSTLNIAKVSSRFLPMLAREVFWDGLPQLSEVVLRVSPDWRTVEKDDAGFAQTTNKFPSDALKLFHREILEMRVAPRESIKKLTIGWSGGGEHAEGMFARNGHLLPAPITRIVHCTANSTAFVTVFNHVEHLTLSNCWVTPPALEGLIKGHSNKALKKLTLDSVSLTAHPRFPNNMHGAGAQQFAQAMAVMQAHLANQNPAVPGLQAAPQAQQLPGVPQNLNPQQMALLQQQINQQWQQHIQQLQQQVNANNLNPPPAPVVGLQPGNGNGNVGPQTNNHWTAGHREGSWPQIIDLISPGPTFNDYLPAPEAWEEPFPPRPETSLRAIEFKSCGYAKLPHHTGFDQTIVEPGAQNRHVQTPWFQTRYGSLKSAMMTTTDRNIGQIVQFMPWSELNALQFAWGLVQGWQDRSRAEEPEFDGFAPGGTGRFSGVIQRGMGLVNALVNAQGADARVN